MDDDKKHSITLIMIPGGATVNVLVPVNSVMPHVRTPVGVAWKLTQECLAKECLIAWVTFYPGGKETGTFYYADLIELKGTEKKIYMNGASHEIRICSVQESQIVCINAMPNIEKELFKGQFYSTNKEAIESVLTSVCEICTQQIDPLSKEKDRLITLFGASCLGGEEDTSCLIIPDENIH